jgi:16S rRNA (guanine(966)-N(2))-methyltransferase RsmD
MRIQTGFFKGRRLFSPKTLETRPVTDFAKAAIFNIIGDKIIDANILDFFSGTGQIGIEALSRGAKHVSFVDYSNQAETILLKNLSLINSKSNSTILKKDWLTGLHLLKEQNAKFDIIFCDPPYKLNILGDLLRIIHKEELLNPDGLIIYRCYKKLELPELSNFILYKERLYGEMKILMFTR